MEKNSYYVYMLRCEDNSIYTGITNDIKRRINEHLTKDKKCAKYTLNHNVTKLEALWQTENRVLASKLEFWIKKLSKAQKEELIANNSLSTLLNEKLDVTKYERINYINEE